jgi:hypothetical protein
MTNPLDPLESLESLESLQSKAETRADSRTASDGWAAHACVMDRLAANVRVAQARGWTSCAIERIDDAQQFSAWGVPPGECQRHPIPDWSMDPDGPERRPHESG